MRGMAVRGEEGGGHAQRRRRRRVPRTHTLTHAHTAGEEKQKGGIVGRGGWRRRRRRCCMLGPSLGGRQAGRGRENASAHAPSLDEKEQADERHLVDILGKGREGGRRPKFARPSLSCPRPIHMPPTHPLSPSYTHTPVRMDPSLPPPPPSRDLPFQPPPPPSQAARVPNFILSSPPSSARPLKWSDSSSSIRGGASVRPAASRPAIIPGRENKTF